MNQQIQIALGIVSALTLIGIAISFLRKSKVYAGYEEHSTEIDKIVRLLRAELFRDGDDVVVTGNHKKNPVQVRFSRSETTPGLNVRMLAAVSFTFSVAPKGTSASEGRVQMRSGDDMFDAKFTSRTDHPTQARMLMSSKVMRKQIEQLCCSSKTFVTLTRGTMELSELMIPGPYTARHVSDHLESLSLLAAAVHDIPGAETIKITPYERKKTTPVFRIALAIGAACTLGAVFVLQPTSAQPDLSSYAEQPNSAAGVNGMDALSIRDLQGWRAAEAEEFDGVIVDWLRGAGLEPSGRIEVNLGADGEKDVVYWLRDEKGRNRIIFLKDKTNIYDTHYPDVIGAVRVPRGSLTSINWKIKPTDGAESDGVLLVTRTQQGNTNPVMLFLNKGRIVSGVPVNYEQINLQ